VESCLPKSVNVNIGVAPPIWQAEVA
jgi:hypothetical protein